MLIILFNLCGTYSIIDFKVKLFKYLNFLDLNLCNKKLRDSSNVLKVCLYIAIRSETTTKRKVPQHFSCFPSMLCLD